MPDEIWDEIRVILPLEKPNNTIGRPAVSFRKVLECILYVLRTGCQWKMLPKKTNRKEFDSDEEIVNVENGLLNIHTG
jgi:transposase